MSVSISESTASRANMQMAFATTLVDEWVRCGLTHAVICPGSRSTPMAVALLAHPQVAIHVRLDERSAAFTALGMGLASGHPAVVLTTSGTAAVEVHPAVVEADLARVPLLVCTADRPPELQQVGAPQTIDQQLLFGRAVRWYVDPGVADGATASTWRSLAARTVVEATMGPRGPGPVHVNLQFREPLFGHVAAADLPPGRPLGAPWYQVEMAPREPSTTLVDRIVDAGMRGIRGLIVAGAGCGDPDVVVAASVALGWPVVADPRSGLRRPGPTVVAAADGILRSELFTASHRPEFILRLGASWVSKEVNGFLAWSVWAGAPMVAVVPWGQWEDPSRSVSILAPADPTLTCHAIVNGMRTAMSTDPVYPVPTYDSEWLEDWQAAELAAQGAIGAMLAGRSEDSGHGAAGIHGWTEPRLARELFARLPGATTLVSSSSMPIRDIEAFCAPRVDPPRVVANRGANGIDGVVSTALGVAMATGPTVALVGDLAFLHDVSALVHGGGADVPCTVVVADNNGGGIFSFLPPVSELDVDVFETLFGTPQTPDVVAVARGFGIPVDDIELGDGPEALAEALTRRADGGVLAVIRVRLPNRSENVAIHAEINRAVVAAVDARGRGDR